MTTKAIDVSSWQHPGGAVIDWHAVKEAGYDGVWIKCTQGVTYVNPYFHADAADALAAGLVVGAYHFAEPWHNTAEAEAAYALAACQGVALDLGLALDLEQINTLQPHEAGTWAQTFLATVAAHHTLAPLYTDQWLYGQMPGAPFGFPLWIADPSGTFDGTWWAKQTGKDTVSGVAGLVDQDTIANVRGVNPGGTAAPPVVVPPSTGGGSTATPPGATPGPTTGGLLDVNVPELSVTAPGPGVASGAVRALQALLSVKFGANLGPSGIDGHFGPVTENAVRWVQGEAHGAAGPSDGVVGPLTWSYLITFGN
jgi:lysozyme